MNAEMTRQKIHQSLGGEGVLRKACHGRQLFVQWIWII
jgi:hypothetical protein